jgi:hypothetical protein
MLWQIVHSFRHVADLKQADESFRRGWAEARTGETLPAADLWTGIDAE